MDCARGEARRSGLDSTHQIRLQITFSHFLNARVGVRSGPPAEREIVFQNSVARGTVPRFADEPKLQLCAAITSDGKSHRIVRAFLGQTRAPGSVTEIAEFPQFLIRRFCVFIARRGAMANPSPAQRQTRRMKPPAIFQLAGRHEEWTRHSLNS